VSLGIKAIVGSPSGERLVVAPGRWPYNLIIFPARAASCCDMLCLDPHTWKARHDSNAHQLGPVYA
ncbi:MAG: hypothetical protein OEU36_25650, partial [Gammaproteobacteria bacterium]|nr:hypothetical protein [Gammaproteobacteria bacterium]